MILLLRIGLPTSEVYLWVLTCVYCRSRRHVFDLVVVLLSLVALGPINVPVNVLRVLRAFRVLRMLGRLRALRRVVESVGLTVLPVLNVFAVILLVASICTHVYISPPSSVSFQLS